MLPYDSEDNSNIMLSRKETFGSFTDLSSLMEENNHPNIETGQRSFTKTGDFGNSEISLFSVIPDSPSCDTNGTGASGGAKGFAKKGSFGSARDLLSKVANQFTSPKPKLSERENSTPQFTKVNASPLMQNYVSAPASEANDDRFQSSRKAKKATFVIHQDSPAAEVKPFNSSFSPENSNNNYMTEQTEVLPDVVGVESEGEEDDEQEVVDMFSKVRHNRHEYVEESIANGFNVNARDEKGNSLLHICAQNNLKKMAVLIVRNGGRINSKNTKGYTPLDYCNKYGFEKLANWFQQNSE